MPIKTRNIRRTIRFLKREKPRMSQKQRLAIALETARKAGAKIPRRSSQISALLRRVKPIRRKRGKTVGRRIAEPFKKKKRKPITSKAKRIGISILKRAVTGASIGRVARRGIQAARKSKLGGFLKHGFVPKKRKGR